MRLWEYRLTDSEIIRLVSEVVREGPNAYYMDTLFQRLIPKTDVGHVISKPMEMSTPIYCVFLLERDDELARQMFVNHLQAQLEIAQQPFAAWSHE